MEHLFEKLTEIINKYDSFIIMGHKDPDLDSLGSGLGLCEIIESFGKKAYLFLNDKNLVNYNNNIKQTFEKMEKNVICVDEKSYKKINGKILLIITDTHIEQRLECPKLINEYDVLVLDHHIKNKNYIKDTIFTYIDSNLSSMSELITYFAQYVNIKLNNVISSVLLAGIEIDTNGFNLKTTSRTYEAASILMEMGADSILKQELLKESKEDYLKRATNIGGSFMVTDNIAMCVINKIATSKELAETAEELLNFEDVEASFVLGKLEEGFIGVSARSLGDINVNELIKVLGGGGHNSNSAAQINGKSLKEVKQQIIEYINMYYLDK